MNQPVFFEIGPHRLKLLNRLLKKNKVYFKKALILGDDQTFRLGGNSIARDLCKHKVNVVKTHVSKSDEPAVAKIMSLVKKTKPDIILGFGGGKVLDVAKLAAGRTRRKFISIPTTLSNDGIASPVSVIKNKKNIPVSHLTRAPYGVIVDLGVVKKAPVRCIKAGVGDLVSNLSAVFDTRLRKGGEKAGKNILMLAETGPRALLKLKTHNIKSDLFLACLTDGLIKSGLAMCLSGSSRPASGSEHKISHALDYMYPGRKTLHGEQVGFAALVTMALQGNKYLTAVKKLYVKIGFLQKVKSLGISNNEFVEIILNARKIRPERYTILEHIQPNAGKIKKIIKELKLV
ncbi:MAG TPA: iron-containing alcohol dehydrogenase [bacterium]|jgi:glycerol-1-phosphate dehydrogenase [NAD(P)+]